MTTDTPISKQKRSKLKITLDGMIDIFCYALETDGAENTEDFFDKMNKYCSIAEGWPQAARVIRGIIAKAKKLEKEERMAEELAKLRAGAPNLLLMNQNEAYGLKESRKISNRDISLTGEHAIYEENNQPKEKKIWGER